MTRNVSEAASGASDISVNIGGVAEAAEGTLSRAQESQKAAQELASIATQLSSLMRQFKITRREKRIDISLPVSLTAIDANGRPLNLEVMTVDVSRQGAQLTGIRGTLRRGDQVSLGRLHKLEQFLISWVGEENTPKAGQIGVSANDPATSFWSDVIEKHSQAQTASPEQYNSEQVPAMPKARARGA
jgi:hypothetical protein